MLSKWSGHKDLAILLSSVVSLALSSQAVEGKSLIVEWLVRNDLVFPSVINSNAIGIPEATLGKRFVWGRVCALLIIYLF